MEILILENTILYKRMRQNIQFDTKFTKPSWFKESNDVTPTYGEFQYQIKIGRNIKLLDIMSWEFRMDFLDKLYHHYQGSELLNVQKRMLKSFCLMALGIPNLETQMKLMQRYCNPPPSPTTDMKIKDDLLECVAPFMGHRYSENTIDKVLADTLKILYPNYDGYCQKYNIASLWMTCFHSEICIFDISKCNVIDLSTSGGCNKQFNNLKGGAKDKMLLNDPFFLKMNNILSEEISQQTAAMSRLMLREDGFTDEEIDKRKDSSGFIVFPDRQTREERRLLKINKISKKDITYLHSLMLDPNKKIDTRNRVRYNLINGVCVPYIDEKDQVSFS
jgi:hypothetical protein